ncbi:MAG: BsaWI family type II restriction enzyme [Pseudanabaenaceae cyanobacterium bins.39]|nr:BsaWI family type II restriction enzyme [Pseudanabaenaceae cyanobacterium bins.39]
MTEIAPSKDEAKFLKGLSKIYYMPIIQKNVDNWVKSYPDPKFGWIEVLNHLNEILRDSQNDIEILLDERVAAGKIKDKSQTRKSIVGNAFSNIIVYIFIQNKLFGNISESIYITSMIASISGFEKISTINVGDETQKPDMDLVIYSLKENQDLNKCIILSLKTSLRERAGQTYKWKLLMEIAMSDCEVRDKYEISYDPPTVPLFCFVTVNFYNEINNPQHRGMFKFFDRAFIGKPIDPQVTNFISPLSTLIDFANENLT